MRLPPTAVAAGPASPASPASSGPTAAASSAIPGFPYDSESWSSLIGIVTAIVGNVLISFALNAQRYAHLRLEREWQAKERARKRRRGSQARIAEERAKANLAGDDHPPRHAEYTGEDDGYIATEADPLVPSVHASHRHSHSRQPADAPHVAYKQPSYLKSPYWWAAIILMTVGEAGNFLAYGFAPASIVSPLGVVALISNCIIAPFLLKERFRKRDGLGVLVAVGGAVTVVLSASDNNPKLGPDEIWKLITRWQFETYLGITAAVSIALMAASNRYGGKSILVDLGLVGLFGGYTALSTKGVASMLSYTLWRAITFPVTYLLVAVLVITAVMQIKYVNRALQRFDATQVIPIQFVTFTLSVILGSAILYGDFERTSGRDAGKFVGGCFLTFLGVWLITSGRHQPIDEDDEDREPEGDDSISLVDGELYHDDSDAGTSTSSLQAPSPSGAAKSNSSKQGKPPTQNPDITFNDQSWAPRTLAGTPTSEVPSPRTIIPQDKNTQRTSNAKSPHPLSRHSTPSTPFLLPAASGTPEASRSSPDLALNTPPPPRTPTRGISDTLLPTTPSTTGTLPPRLRRIGTAERVGNRNPIPAPLLASPLSTSLSAIVADLKRGGSLRGPQLHRDYDGTRIGPKRRESVLGIGASEVSNDENGEPLDRRRTATDETPVRGGDTSAGRGRSLSGTLTELWRGVKGGETTGHKEDEESRARGR
ncbi:magnesium transporter NIPA-domain-containing protein [Massariosphaeria phaeospora]|uniref:Magnesium transporter NIPA-domain-containing protein n=1 Tax=Massariosphaeria phaeospora TaxID=100035 RepID=A0A7C8M2X3_9PLEO|nr:magnesium transporter NIPA-domain-containing protein [Massariosphaeria phaeospora]